MWKVWMAGGVLSALVASVFIMATVCLTHLTQLKADIEGVQSDVHSKLAEYSNALQYNNRTSDTTPSVEFSVGSSEAFKSVYGAARVPMEVIFHNNGGYYHDEAFHAPLKGVYYFTFSATANWSSSEDFKCLCLYSETPGGSEVKTWKSLREVEFRVSVRASVLIKLDVDEMVSVWLTVGSALLGYTPPGTLFSGELIYQLD